MAFVAILQRLVGFSKLQQSNFSIRNLTINESIDVLGKSHILVEMLQ